MKYKLTKTEAEIYLHELWEQGELPTNFTEDHTDYEDVVVNVMINGFFNYEDYLF